MATKELRILIADEQHSRRLILEKTLNKLGYFRIAPAQFLDELLALSCYLKAPYGYFDALLVDVGLISRAEMELEQLCIDIIKVNRTLVYGVKSESWTRVLSCNPDSLELHLMEKIDDSSVRRFMEYIDPAIESDIFSTASSEASLGRNSIPVKYFS